MLAHTVALAHARVMVCPNGGADIGKDRVMANNIGKVQLEFYGEGSDTPWTFGTDAIVWVDGRWSHSRAVDYLEERAREYCDTYNSRATRKIEWRRSVYLLGSRYRSIKV